MLRRLLRSVRRVVQPRKYAVIDTEAALFRFDTPSDPWQAKLMEAVLRLPAADIDPTEHVYALETATILRNAEAVIARLETALRSDYDSLTGGADRWRGTFDFVIMLEPGPRPRLHVLTRLRLGTDSGAGCYGPTIQHLSDNQYALWDDV